MNKYKNLYEQLDRMTELINYGNIIEEDYFIIYEGLVKTTMLDKTRVLIERLFSTYGLYWRDKIEIDEKSDTLLVDILDFEGDTNKIDGFLKYVNNLGYFISIIYFKKKGETKLIDKEYDINFLISKSKEYKNLNNLIVVLEANFDIERPVPEKLYHVTRQEVLEKIKQIGIVPKSKSKKSTHPERIYFAKTYDDTYDIYGNFKKEAPDQKFAILEINTSKVNHIRVFDDPNYKGFGLYGLVNIPPNAIKIVKENI